jgi:energy-coupling factor transport system ATP-binding protein
MIKANHLGFNYPNGPTILDNLSFEVRKGEFVALIGQNGAGKTTLLKQFNGLLKPSSGEVLIDLVNTKDAPTAVLARKIGYLFQNPDHQIFMPTVAGEIGFGPGNLGLTKPEVERRVAEAAERVGLAAYLPENPLFLSKGQRQRVAFASLLAMRPEVLVLDEPTTGQDYREGIEIMEMVRELHQAGHTIIFVTHDMELVAQYAKRVIVLAQGRILADDTCRNVFYQPEILEATNLFPPQIARLVQQLDGADVRPGTAKALTVAELHEQIRNRMGGDRRVGCR